MTPNDATYAITHVVLFYKAAYVLQRWAIRYGLGCVNPASWLPLAEGHDARVPAT